MQQSFPQSKTLNSDSQLSGKLLVVDQSNKQLQTLVADFGLSVTFLDRYEEVLPELQTGQYDLLLITATLPDPASFALCQNIKNTPELANPKIIFVAENGTTEDKERAFEAGVADFLTLPISPLELQTRLKLLLNLSRAEAELYNRNNHLRELMRISNLINLHLDLTTVANEIVKSARDLTGSEWAYLMLWEEENKGHRCLSALNYNLEFVGMLIAEDEGISGAVRAKGQPVLISDYQNSEWRLKNITTDKIREMAGVPLTIGQKHLGVLSVSVGKLDKHFTSYDLDTLTNLANQAAVVIENTRLYGDLSRKEETYRLITEKANDLIVSVNAEGTITFINERSRSMLGVEPAELIGSSIQRFLTPDALNTFYVVFESLRTEEQQKQINRISQSSYELMILNRDGTPLSLEFNFGLLFNENKVVGIQGIGRDVTSRKRSEENERMRILGQMASGVAHDFNNVLANVLGHAQLLETQIENEDILNTLQIIAQSARDGAETVRRIQEFTGQRTPTDFDLLDLNQIVQGTIDLSRPRWRDDAQLNSMQIEIEREFETIPLVRGKAAELREVIINIINNAVDSMTPTGGKLRFRTSYQNNWVVLELADTGKGMSPEVRRHIFEPFFTTKGVRGTGLGLSVAFGIINRYKGEISCDSVVGQGTVFTIRLPAAEPNQEEASMAKTKVVVKPVLKQYQGRILAIDDEPGIRSVVRRALQSSGFNIEVAASGAEALAMLEKASIINQARPYDLVLSDLGMPEMGGWEVARLVHSRWAEIPVVLVTGWGEQLDPAKMAENQIADIISKPFNIQELVRVAVRHIRQPGES